MRQVVCSQDASLCVAPSIAGMVISQGNRALTLSRLASGILIAIAQSIQPALEQLQCMDCKAVRAIQNQFPAPKNFVTALFTRRIMKFSKLYFYGQNNIVHKYISLNKYSSSLWYSYPCTNC